jgi:hypothetical protein
MKKYLLALLLWVPTVSIGIENNCLDPASREGWAKKHAESPGDPVLTRLYALWLGLCELVKTDRVLASPSSYSNRNAPRV